LTAPFTQTTSVVLPTSLLDKPTYSGTHRLALFVGHLGSLTLDAVLYMWAVLTAFAVIGRSKFLAEQYPPAVMT
jgi:hypothetical protein